MAPDELFNGDIAITKKLAHWAVNQGVATILLLMILYGIYGLTPSLISQIQEGYKQNAAQLERVIEINNRQLERVMTSVEADRKTLIQMLHNIRDQQQEK